jgi:FHA domain-containing protein
VIVLRLLRDGTVVREAVVRDLPVRLGRDASCEFPLTDPSVSRVHAVVDAAAGGGVELRDLESRNGTWSGAGRVSALPLAGPTRCRLGRVELEIEPLDADAPTIELALDDLRPERRRGVADHVRYLGLGIVGWLGAVTLDPQLWSPWNRNRAGSLLGHGISAFITLPVFALVLLIALKAVGRRVRLADTLLALARVIWLWPLSFATTFLLYYVLSSAALDALRFVIGLLVGVVAVVMLVSVRRPGPSRLFRTAWALGTAVILFGIAWTFRLAAERTGQPSLDTHVQIPLGSWPGRAESLDAYFTQVTAEAEQASAEAEAVRVRQNR